MKFYQTVGDVPAFVDSVRFPKDFKERRTQIVRLGGLARNAVIQKLLPGSHLDTDVHVLYRVNGKTNASPTQIQIPVVPEKDAAMTPGVAVGGVPHPPQTPANLRRHPKKNQRVKRPAGGLGAARPQS